MKVNLGSGKNYLEGYVNIDIDPMWKPDLVMDISRYNPPAEHLGSVEEIIAHDVLEHISDLVSAMTNCLSLLKEGGTMDIAVPYYLSLGAWQDPTHVRAFNENSWLYYTDWFWYLGWKEYRFEIVELKFISSIWGEHIREDDLHVPKSVDSMRVILRKILLTDKEKMAGEAYYGIQK